jgi:hypothetical protein
MKDTFSFFFTFEVCEYQKKKKLKAIDKTL